MAAKFAAQSIWIKNSASICNRQADRGREKEKSRRGERIGEGDWMKALFYLRGLK